MSVPNFIAFHPTVAETFHFKTPTVNRIVVLKKSNKGMSKVSQVHPLETMQMSGVTQILQSGPKAANGTTT